MSAAGGTRVLTLDDLGAANVQWSDQFLLLLKEHLYDTGLDTEKAIPDAWRRAQTVSFLFDYPASEKFSQVAMGPHVRRCANKAWQETGKPRELRAQKLFLVHTADKEQCVVFVMFEYEYCVEGAHVTEFLQEVGLLRRADRDEHDGEENGTPKPRVPRDARRKGKPRRRGKKR